MSSADDLLPCPFVAGPKITDLRLFVGRREVLQELASRMSAAQPMSVNLVGERRIGKSSLLYAFTQLWDQHIPRETRWRAYVVIYLDLQEIRPRSTEHFYRAILEALRRRPLWSQFPELQHALQTCSPEQAGFSVFLEACQTHKLLPVICLDEFEVLFDSPQDFDDAFFDVHRGYMNASKLMYIIATHRSLDFYRKQHRLTSSFFNVGHVLELGEFTEEEAWDLVRLPASTVEDAPAALEISEQRLARKWGGRHPFLLQLAGYYLCEARRQRKDKSWAKKRFQAEVDRLSEAEVHRPQKLLKRVLRFLWNLPLYLGRLAHGLQKNADDLKDRLTGIAILVLLLLVLLGVLGTDILRAWIETLLEIKP